VNIINCGNSHAPMRLRTCDSSLDGCAKPLFPNAPWTLGTRVMEFCVRELSKKGSFSGITMPPSGRRCKMPKLWYPIGTHIEHSKELNHHQIAALLGLQCTRTAQRNLIAMEEAGILKSRGDDVKKSLRWYSLA
jgi:hypothetical protein